MSGPLFGYGGERHARKGRPTIKRDKGGHERWADAILPADAEAGVIETPTSRRPLIILVLLVATAAGILAFQLFNLQIVHGERNLGLADGNRLRQKITRAPRGVIYDRHKVPLAQNLASFDVTVTPSLLPGDATQRQALYTRVSDLLAIPPAEVAAKAEGDCVNAAVAAKTDRKRAEYSCLSAIQPRLIATNISRETALGFDQSSTEVPGFTLDTNSIREYRDNGSLAALLGYTGRVTEEDITTSAEYSPTDLIGKLGVERQYEDILRGQNGSEQTEVDASGKPIKLLASKPAKAGQNVVLTIDSELQQKLREAIQKQLEASGATQAAGVAIDPRNGEVLAAVSLPTYDNNLFAKGISQEEYSRLVNDKAQPLFNKAISGAYPMGSIIKPLIGSAAIQERTISPETTVNDTGQIEVKNKYDPSKSNIYRSYEPGIGVVNLARAIAVSSDVFFYTVGGGFGNIAGLGVTKLTDYYHKFGLGAKTGIDIPGETAGLVPTPDWKKDVVGEEWVLGDTYNISVGQGDLKASPLQMAMAEAAVANGGKVIQPRLMKEVQDAGGQITKTSEPKVLREGFISPSNINLIRNAMLDAVYQPYGTACCKLGQEVPVRVAAKTGTAETVTTDTGAKNQSKPNAWFTAFAPFDDPQIEIVVLIQNSGEGSKYAAPAVRETLAWCFRRPGGCVQ